MAVVGGGRGLQVAQLVRRDAATGLLGMAWHMSGGGASGRTGTMDG